jgi:hypothetical protein
VGGQWLFPRITIIDPVNPIEGHSTRCYRMQQSSDTVLWVKQKLKLLQLVPRTRQSRTTSSRNKMTMTIVIVIYRD